MLFNKYRGLNLNSVLTSKIVLAGALIFLIANISGADEKEKLDPLDIIIGMQAAYKTVNGYVATFQKAEPVISDENHQEEIFVKFQKPNSVYMKWVGGEHNGREVIYVQGKNDDCFLAKPDGFLGFLVRLVKLPSTYQPTGTRYSIRKAGLGNVIDSIVATTLNAKQNNDLKLICKGVTKRDKFEVYEIERILPAKGCYPNERLELYIDKNTGLPVEAYSYGHDGRLLEYCKYLDMKVNPPLEDIDFSADNKEYGFRYL